MEKGKYVFVFDKISVEEFTDIDDLKWKRVLRGNKLVFNLFDELRKKKNPETETCIYNSKNNLFECPKFIKYILEFRNYKRMGEKIIGNRFGCSKLFNAEFEISKLHHFIKKRVLDKFIINNYFNGGDFIIFEDMSAVLVEYCKNGSYKCVCEGYVKKLDDRNIFSKFLELFKRK